MNNHDYVDPCNIETPANIFNLVVRAIDNIGLDDVEHHIDFLKDMMSSASYSNALTTSIHDATRASVEEILSDTQLMKDFSTWRYWESGYLLDMARATSGVIQKNVKQSLSTTDNIHRTEIHIVTLPPHVRTGNILYAQYCNISHRTLHCDDGVITGFRIRETMRLNKHARANPYNPWEWLSRLFHEHVHGAENQIELMAQHLDKMPDKLSVPMTKDDFDISQERHNLTIDNAFYEAAFALYCETPSEKLARSSQAIFRDGLQEGLLKLIR